MTKEEFMFQIERLKKTFNNKHADKFPDERSLAIFQVVQDLDAKWFQKAVTHMIVKFEDKFDLVQAAREERNNRASLQFAKDVEIATKKFSEAMTDKGFMEKMELFNAKSPTEAFFNFRNSLKTDKDNS